MQNFSLLVKPSSHGCNLRCDYCFYLKKKDMYPETHPKMTLPVLERMISTFQAVPLQAHSYGWQGGEPTTMGLDFFKKVTELQEKHGRNGQPVSNGLQTNGTLIDDEWAKHLAKYNFLVGLSIDGPAEIHDANRPTIGGKGSHAMVMKGRDALIRNGVDYNVLTLVNSLNIKDPVKLYKYVRDELGVNYHQYIECVEFDSKGKLMPYAVTPEQWGEFLCTIFDEWYATDTNNVSVRLFDSILTKIVDNVANACVFSPDCRQYFVVEHNGDIYPCDFFVRPEMLLGNIMTDSWEHALTSPIYEHFGVSKSNWNVKCTTCPYVSICQGCCQKNRWGAGSDPTNLSVLCAGWEIFYGHTLSRFKTLANKIKKQRAEAAAFEEMERRRMAALTRKPSEFGKVGRNDACPCGSGRKYKKCCGK